MQDPKTQTARAGRYGRLLILWVCAIALAGCSPRDEPIRVSGPAQGTTFNVTVMSPDGVDQASVASAVQRVIDTVDDQMSTWRDDSEISRFNRAPAGEWVPVSGDLAKITRQALALGRQTNGAFDVTLGPILKVWGFGAGADVPSKLPTTETLNAAREKTGIGQIDVRMEPPALRKKVDGITLDLAGLAQGYTVDRIADALRQLGAEHFLAELGGELYAQGTKESDKPWRIGVEKPEAGVRTIERVVGLADAGMTTSGDYRDYFELDGHRFSHTIDPRTGRPVAHDLRAVTVIAQDAMTADAMATALLVMGPEAGLRYANANGIAALFVRGNDDAYTESNSKAFEPYLKEAP
ncbi:FAD:protein FMN transferase [Salinisphaera sp. T31B1]|uniref:FAD:protein FMN transferase n=1 Tax=Salinisphaera sp. T31B1 TaxID=727963 RepID=UPI00333F256D